MNLADITTKCYILALIIRDDGERLLLGDGAYEFKDSQQHFIANTYANDVVELQGTDGQMLAGQVRRTATQTFAGYIGDATFSKQRIEQARRDFLMFFRKKHYYTAVYVFSDGTAIQRDRGYIVNAPSVPELYQRFPEWSVGLNFEDPNYYEYAEDDLGHEIAAHKVELELSTAMSGGLIWDNDGAVSDDLSYVGTEIPGEGKNFQLTDTGTATLKSAELLGNAEQTTYSGKNKLAYTLDSLKNANPGGTWSGNSYTFNGITYRVNDDLTITTTGTASGASYLIINDNLSLASGSSYTMSGCPSGGAINGYSMRLYGGGSYTSDIGAGLSFSYSNQNLVRINVYNGTNIGTKTFEPMIELGSTKTAYEPYVGGTASPNPDYPQPISVVTGENVVKIEGSDDSKEFEVNLGKNLFDKDSASRIYAYIQNNTNWRYYNDSYSLRIPCQPNTTYTLSANNPSETIFRAGVTDSDTIPSSDVDVAIYSTTRYSNTNTPIYLTTGANAKYIVVQIAEETASGTLATLQLEKGSQATSFAPYFPPIELAKIGNYQDRIYKSEGKWYIEKQVGKSTFDGTETGWSAGAGNRMFFRNDNTYAMAEGNDNIGAVMSNYFTADTYTYVYSGDVDYGIALGGTARRLAIRNKDCADLASFKTWLGTHNTTVYYALATPTTTEITNSELVGQLERLKHAHTYADATNFSITATSPNLPAFLKVVAFGDDAIPQGGYVWEDGGTGGATIITVDGVDNAQPIWTVVGPATNPSLTNITTGESIQWTGVVPNGQTLVVNMADMTASLSGANVFEFISGSWITLQAGNNRVSYSATAATGIATLEWNGVVG